MKIVIAVAALIIAVMVAAAYFSFNPSIPVFLILGYGIYRVGRDGEALPPGDINTHWGSGHGHLFRQGRRLGSRRRLRRAPHLR
jgi:hypothetical protein